MSRFEDIVRLIEYDYNKNVIIEPQSRLGFLKEIIAQSVKKHKPAVIVKAGLGNSGLAASIAEETDSLLVIVEPCLNVINKFREEYKEKSFFSGIKIINGNFDKFPVDYYSADMLICLDILDFVNSAAVIDEFRLALKFGGYFILGGLLLHDDDAEGVFDDLMRSIFPLHTDYYPENDLNTVMNLNEFSLLDSKIESVPLDLAMRHEYFCKLFGSEAGDFKKFIEEHIEEFSKLYKLKGATIKVPYFTGLFIRRKPDFNNTKI